MIQENEGLFDSHFLKLFLRIIFENTENTILVFSENFSCSMNLVFFVFFIFFITKKKKKKKKN